MGIATRTATRTEGVGVTVGDEEDKDGSWLAIDNAVVGGGNGGDRFLVKGRMNRGGRNEGSAGFSAELAVGP